MTLETMQETIYELEQRHAISASLEYPGFISVEVDAKGRTFSLAFGDANDLWGCSVNIVLHQRDDEPGIVDPFDGEPSYVETPIPCTCTDAAKLADATAAAIEQFKRDVQPNDTGDIEQILTESQRCPTCGEILDCGECHACTANGSKPFYCCNKAFYSAAALEAHTLEAGHSDDEGEEQ